MQSVPWLETEVLSFQFPQSQSDMRAYFHSFFASLEKNKKENLVSQNTRKLPGPEKCPARLPENIFSCFVECMKIAGPRKPRHFPP